MKQNWQWTAVFVIGFRLFLQATLLERRCYSACWLVPVGGFLIAMPVVWFAICHLRDGPFIHLQFKRAGGAAFLSSILRRMEVFP